MGNHTEGKSEHETRDNRRDERGVVEHPERYGTRRSNRNRTEGRSALG
jgi:hypothetical protein